MIFDSGSRILVLDDRVRLAELRRQLLVLGEVGEQLADRVVDLLGVLEVGPMLRESYAPRAHGHSPAYGSASTCGKRPPPNACGNRPTLLDCSVQAREDRLRGRTGAAAAGSKFSPMGKESPPATRGVRRRLGSRSTSSSGALELALLHVEAREDLALRVASRRVPDRERQQVAVAAVRPPALRIDRERLGVDDRAPGARGAAGWAVRARPAARPRSRPRGWRGSRRAAACRSRA